MSRVHGDSFTVDESLTTVGTPFAAVHVGTPFAAVHESASRRVISPTRTTHLLLTVDESPRLISRWL